MSIPDTCYVVDKAILFLTDGDPTEDEDVIMNTLKRLNAQQNNDYIMFTYAIGEGCYNFYKLS